MFLLSIRELLILESKNNLIFLLSQQKNKFPLNLIETNSLSFEASFLG